MVKVLPD